MEKNTLMDYFCLFTVRVEKMAECTLESDAQYARFPNINSITGDVLLQAEQKKKNERLLYKYSLHQDGSYRNEWKRQCPENKDLDKYYLTDAGDVILKYYDNDHTYLFDQDMQLMDSWQCQGNLVTCLPGPRTVYSVKKGEEHVIDIRNQDGEILQLKPEGNTWNYDPDSVCEDQRTRKIVAVEGRSVNFFSRDGKPQHILYYYLCVFVGSHVL